MYHPPTSVDAISRFVVACRHPCCCCLVSEPTPPSRTSASPLACAAQEADNLRGYWRALPLQQRRHFLEGLPDAAALAGDSGDGTAMSSCSGGGKVDLVQNLMLAPVAWCFKVR